MSKTGWVSRALRMIRCTPLHPQWLLGRDVRMFRTLVAGARGRVLDIGCADRWIERHISQSCEYVGVDFPITGKALYGSRPDVFADAARLPFVDQSVDTVVLLEVIEHLRHPTQALSETARVLRPTGRVFLSVPFLYPIHDAPHDYQRLTRHGLLRDLESAGLCMESLTPRLGSMESAALLACLAIGGTFVHALRVRHPGVFLSALLLPAIPMVNLAGWVCGKLMPAWSAFTNGYIVTASRPTQSA